MGLRQIIHRAWFERIYFAFCAKQNCQIGCDFASAEIIANLCLLLRLTDHMWLLMCAFMFTKFYLCLRSFQITSEFQRCLPICVCLIKYVFADVAKLSQICRDVCQSVFAQLNMPIAVAKLCVICRDVIIKYVFADVAKSSQICRDICQSVFTRLYMCLPTLPNCLWFSEMFANLAITRSLSLSSQAQAAIKWVINAKSRMRRC